MPIAETGSNKSTGTSQTPNITHGLTINSGDKVVITGNANASGNVWSDNNGSTPLTVDFGETGSGNNTYAIMSRIAGASEPANYTFNLSGSSQAWSIIIRVFSGGHASTMWNVAPAAGTRASGTGTTATSPNMTTTVAGAMGVLFCSNDTAATTLSAPTNGYGTLVEHHTSRDRKSTRLNSSHSQISYAVFCLKKNRKIRKYERLPTPFCNLSHRRFSHCAS